METGKSTIMALIWVFCATLVFVLSPANVPAETTTYSPQRVNELKRLIKNLEPVKQEIQADHPGDTRHPYDIVKQDIIFETLVDDKLTDAKLAVTAAWAEAKSRAKFELAQRNLEKFNIKIDPGGDYLYFTKPFPLGLPIVFPPQGQFLTFTGMIQILEDFIDDNDAKLKIRKAQLPKMEELAAYEQELETLLRLGKTVEDLWIFDSDLEATDSPTRFKALVNSTLELKVLVRYTDGSQFEFLGSKPGEGIEINYDGSESNQLRVREAKEYPVTVRFPDGKFYHFNVIGYSKTDLFSFLAPAQNVREGSNSIALVGLERKGSGNGRVELRFKEIHGQGLGYGDYAVIDPFPVWEDGETGVKYIQVKIEDNTENNYNKILTLELIPSDKVTLVSPATTRITIEDDDLAGQIKFSRPDYDVLETDKTVVIELRRIGQNIMESSLVRVRTRDGSAKAGQDYTAIDTSINWDRSDVSATKKISIPILEDATAENNENFQVLLGDGSKETAQVLIREKSPVKPPEVQRAGFSSSRYHASESDGAILVQIVREGGTKGRFSIDMYTRDATAVDGWDYMEVRKTLTWEDGDGSTKQVMIPIIDDQEIEDPAETVHLQLENPVNNSFPVDYHPSATEAALEIADNDGASDPDDDTSKDDSKNDAKAFSASPECGSSFELAPGDFAGRSCGIVVQGIRSNTADRVDVKFSYTKSRGLDIFPGNTSTIPSLIFTDPYTFSQSFRAEPDAAPGLVLVSVTVSQQGAGSVTFNLEISILEKGQIPSSGPGIRPPVDMAQGSGGNYCVWRYKMFGDPPPCFHFASAPCDSPRYRQSSYELVGQGMTWGEADTLMSRLSRYHKDAYGCLDSQFPIQPDNDGDGTPDKDDDCPKDPKKIAKGVCGCGKPETDSDEDGTPDCIDKCPDDPKKIVEGICGCGESDEDFDKDGTPDCNDECDDDPNKQKEGECGCHVPDEDKNGDGILDCKEKKLILSSMQISPGSATINVNGSAAFSVTIFDDQGAPLSSQAASALSISWAVNDPSVANISGSGLQGSVSPIKEGSVTVMVSAGQVSAYATVVIQPLDTDEDGVPDSRDNCPGTPTRTKVGADGCPQKKGCTKDSCPQGFVCNSKTGKCISPFDDSYGDFTNTQNQREDNRSQGQSDQAAADQGAGGENSNGSGGLGQALDNNQTDLSKICQDDTTCLQGQVCKNGVCVDRASQAGSGSQQGTSKPDPAKPGTPKPPVPPTTPPSPTPDPSPQNPVVQNRTLKWHSSSVCNEAEGTLYGWQWLVSLNQSGDSVSGSIYFHKCPGGGRASYSLTGKANADGSFAVNGTRGDSRGPLANTAPRQRNFVLREGQPPNPGL